MSEAEKILRSAKPNTFAEREALLSLYLYFTVFGENGKAQELASELVAKYKDSEIEHDLEMALEAKAILSKSDFKLGKSSIPFSKNALNNDKKGLFSAAPNPFNLSTKMSYAINEKADISLCVYNIRGELVKTIYQGVREPGVFSDLWDGQDSFGNTVSSGVYLVSLAGLAKNHVLKVTVIK